MRPRAHHKRGKEVKKRGISSEQVCVLTSLDCYGNIYLALICKGRFKSSDLNRVLEGHIETGLISCTDNHKGYLQIVVDYDLDHKRIKSSRH